MPVIPDLSRTEHWFGIGLSALLFIAHILTAARALTRANRTPASRVAWVCVIMLTPLVGVIAYWILGETLIGSGRVQRIGDVESRISPPIDWTRFNASPRLMCMQAAPLFELAFSINQMPAVDGNRISLLGDDTADAHDPGADTFAAMQVLIDDIDRAAQSVHVAFYIWLDDEVGGAVAQAIIRAAQRGVQCRVMVDALGSRQFSHGPRWEQLRTAGVQLLITLDDINRWRHIALSRMDLRDHRKIIVIDNTIAYCGSVNCASPAFAVKGKFAPWVDIVLRCEGPIVRQFQYLFLGGWLPEMPEQGMDRFAYAPGITDYGDGCPAVAFETSPLTRHNAMADMFVECIYAARNELIVTTPYFVPDESILRALCAAPRRGVRTRVIVPARNDSWFVGTVCRSTYRDMLDCGVEIYEYPLGVLHAKSLTADGKIALVGSANMDRRSLELNFENSLLLEDAGVVRQLVRRQERYLSVARRVSKSEVDAWSFRQRLVQNAVAMMSPVL